jgi:excinuclease ABC subunit C
MVKNASLVEYTVVESEHDALFLENTLIKKFQPRYNVMLKDAKSYTYLCIKKERFPRIFFTRKVVRDGSKYFGPYTSKYKTKQIFELIKQLFPLRTCSLNLSEKNIREGKFKVCLEYHLGNCLGPCVGNQSEVDYAQSIEQVRNILNGHFRPVKDFIHQEMNRYAQELQFENAEKMKERLAYIEDYQAKSLVVSQHIKDLDIFSIQSEAEVAYVNYLKIVNGALINTDTIELKKNLNTEESNLLSYAIHELREKYNSIAPEIAVPLKVKTHDPTLRIIIPKKGDKRKLLDLAEKNLRYYLLQVKKNEMNARKKESSAERILKTLQKDLEMETMPFHIECFDNSNLQGHAGVASCVVFKNAKPAKKDYRKFNIKTVEGADDYASMKEVVYRRYSRLLKENQPLPQLIIIDGGKGQLNSAYESLKELEIEEKTTLIGIAKKLEKIFRANDPIPIYLNKKSESLKLIQQARNEAHRFAITFHRDKRSSRFLKDSLSELPGIGTKTSEKLLKHFGSLKRLSQATMEEIEAVVGKHKASLIHLWQTGFEKTDQ